MLVRLLILTGFALAMFAYTAGAAEVDVYGTFNYKLSHDENTSGVAYSKLEDNTSIMGIDVSSPLATDLAGFAKLEVGVDTDDSGSDTLDSRLAYVGLKTGSGHSVSAGRQSHPFTDNIGGKTSIFNVYGSSADFNYGSRSSNSIGFSIGEGSAVSIDGLAILNGSAGQSDSFDEYEATVSTNVSGIDVSLGYADDRVNSISYYGVASSATVSDKLSLGTSYTIKDSASADLTGWEATASYDILSIGYGDKEGTGNYTTVGLAKEVADGLTLYGEAELIDNNTGTDQEKWSLGAKYSF